jgi:hypothetical protein
LRVLAAGALIGESDLAVLVDDCGRSAAPAWLHPIDQQCEARVRRRDVENSSYDVPISDVTEYLRLGGRRRRFSRGLGLCHALVSQQCIELRLAATESLEGLHGAAAAARLEDGLAVFAARFDAGLAIGAGTVSSKAA